MIVSESNIGDEDYVLEILETAGDEQIYVSSACIPLAEYLREKHFELYKKIRDRIPKPGV